jgi:hypothetical protein
MERIRQNIAETKRLRLGLRRRSSRSGPFGQVEPLEWARMGTIVAAEPLSVPAEATKSPV